MKQKVLSIAMVICIATPTFASDLERHFDFNPGEVTAHDLAVLKAISTSEDDFANVRFKRSEFANGPVVSTQSGISSGHAQLAANYGLDPAEYTVAEIMIIAGENQKEERERLIKAYKDEGAVISTQGSGKAHVAKAVELMGGGEDG